MIRLLPPPLWALVLLAATYGLSLAPVLRDAPSMATRPAGTVLAAIALAILFGALLQFRLANTQIMPNSATNNRLVTSGLFAITRNPMYLAMTLLCLAGALWFERPIMLAAPVLMFAVANWAFIPFEEAKMRRQFGETFDAYARRVRRWL